MSISACNTGKKGTTDGFTSGDRAHTPLQPQPAGITLMDASQRGKMFVTADAQGNIWLRHSTSEQVLLKLKPAAADANRSPTASLSLSPPRGRRLRRRRRRQGPRLEIVRAAPWISTLGDHLRQGLGTKATLRRDFTWQSSSGTDA